VLGPSALRMSHCFAPIPIMNRVRYIHCYGASITIAVRCMYCYPTNQAVGLLAGCYPIAIYRWHKG